MHFVSCASWTKKSPVRFHCCVAAPLQSIKPTLFLNRTAASNEGLPTFLCVSIFPKLFTYFFLILFSTSYWSFIMLLMWTLTKHHSPNTVSYLSAFPSNACERLRSTIPRRYLTGRTISQMTSSFFSRIHFLFKVPAECDSKLHAIAHSVRRTHSAAKRTQRYYNTPLC